MASSLQLHGLLSDGVVLQRDAAVRLCGRVEPGGEMTAAFRGYQATTAADASGRWSLQLPPMAAGGPDVLAFGTNGQEPRVVRDVLVGEVWVCGGQSNMELPLRDADPGEAAVAANADLYLRLFDAAKVAADRPADDIAGGRWCGADAATAAGFSAVAYHFGRALRRALGVPVGLIHTSVGATGVACWTPRRTMADETWRQLQRDHKEAAAYHRWAITAHAKGVSPLPWLSPDPWLRRPTGLYHGTIAPLQVHAVRGVIWSQGECDAGRPGRYAELFPRMIEAWRADWGSLQLPFIFAQLASHDGERTRREDWPALREAQARVASTVPHTAMVVTLDVGDAQDIHPRRKKAVGERMALAARAIAYGHGVNWSGPRPVWVHYEGPRVIVRFSDIGERLRSDGGAVRGYELAGADGCYHSAEACIDGDTVIATTAAVSRPVAVRYAWRAWPDANLFGDDLPAAPFQHGST